MQYLLIKVSDDKYTVCEKSLRARVEEKKQKDDRNSRSRDQDNIG